MLWPADGQPEGAQVSAHSREEASQRVNELRDGVVHPFDATRAGRRGSISEIPLEVFGCWRAPAMRTLRLGLAKSLTSLLGVVVLTLAGRAVKS